ncbi:MAG: Hsp70 family protein, partial [Oscillibacter sp.]|nr:Hsp70 family protein [Oscillibacter sp.]
AELIPNAAGEYMTPSAVSVEDDGTILVGQAAKERLVSHPDRSAAGFKRDMGTGRRFRLGQHEFTPEELSSFVLRSLKEDAERYLGEPVTEAVVSVPAYFAEGQRAATKRAAALAGLRVERLLNEPSAAAVAGGSVGEDEQKLVLVFDFGGGTLDVSLVEMFENVVSVVAVSGDVHLGGRDFDAVIARAFCQDCGLEWNRLSPRQRGNLLHQAEVCKVALSSREPVLMSVMDGEISASLILTSEWLLRKCGGLFRRMTAPVRKVFLDAGMPPAELDDLILVGGSSRMPTVRSYISRFLKKEPVRKYPPDTAIALGVGICAGMKEYDRDLRDLILTDICPFTLGVDVINQSDPGRLLMSPIIERNSVLPTSRMGVYSTTRDNQDKVEIRIYQGENRYCADNTYLGKMELSVPPAPAGEQSIRIRFTYDVNGLFEAEAVNDVGESTRLLLRNGDMTEEEVRARLGELEKLKLHPREQAANREVTARGERLYAVTVGRARYQVGQMLDWFQAQMATRDPLKIASARRRAARFFDEVETYLQNEWPDGAEPEPEEDV